MRLGFVVNDVATEHAEYTTTRLALAAKRRGHEVLLMGVGDLGHSASGEVLARARAPFDKSYRSPTSFLQDIQAADRESELISVDEIDVLMLRNDPSADAIDRPWAQTSGVLFGQLTAATGGVIVVNDPGHLADAINKTYFQHFPEEVRPRTLISRNGSDIRDFVSELGGRAVLKPLQGSGGQGVFMVNGKKGQNLNQIIETITRDGYVVTQEYLEDAKKGDVRLFVMNGLPLEVNGKIAAFRRCNEADDIRSNMHVGGKAEKVKVTAEMLALVTMARPKLIQDGMFLVGLDVVGNKLMEANVFSPGGLGSAGILYEEDFAAAVIESLEQKLLIKASYGRSLPNADLATM
jgi:glutathione synthase